MPTALNNAKKASAMHLRCYLTKYPVGEALVRARIGHRMACHRCIRILNATPGSGQISMETVPWPYGGTVWSHVNALWASACVKAGARDSAWRIAVAHRWVLRDGHFAEIYHPETGERYGGEQEAQYSELQNWDSEARQTCAQPAISAW